MLRLSAFLLIFIFNYCYAVSLDSFFNENDWQKINDSYVNKTYIYRKNLKQKDKSNSLVTGLYMRSDLNKKFIKNEDFYKENCNYNNPSVKLVKLEKGVLKNKKPYCLTSLVVDGNSTQQLLTYVETEKGVSVEGVNINLESASNKKNINHENINQNLNIFLKKISNQKERGKL